MGSGDIGTNGSVHYSIRDDDSPAVPPKYKERDPIPYDQIGRGTSGAKGHPGFLAVRMRFPDAAAARSALTAAIGTIGTITGGNGFYATCMVPVVTPVRPNADADPFNEVKVDW